MYALHSSLDSALAPAFLGGFPGGMELLVIFLLAAAVFGIPTLLLLGGGGYLITRTSQRDERLAELEREVDDLRERVGDASRDENDGEGGDTASRDDER